LTFDAGQFVIAAFLAFCRIGGCFMVMPGLASVRVPTQVRLFVAVAVSMAILANDWDMFTSHAQRTADVVVRSIVTELAIGVLIGLLARIYLMALQFMGSAMAMLVGYGGGVASPIEEAEPQAPLATILSFSALLVLFALDFHHQVIAALLTSYRLLPPGAPFNAQAALVDITDTLGDTFLAVLRLGSPFVAYAVLINLAIGFLNKLTPQIPVYFISQPFVLAGGLILLYFGAAPLLRLFVDGFVPLTIGR